MAVIEQDELSIAIERITPQWLAGFFDGEGCISVVRHRYGIPSLIVTLTQADYNTLALIQMKFSLPNKPYQKAKSRLARKKSFCLQMSGRTAIPFLELIRPYAVQKRRLVEWGIELANLHGTPGGNRRNFRGKLETEVRSRREQLLTTIRAENKAGRIQ